VSNSKSSGLIAVLHADEPAADRAAALELYGRFVGDWDAEPTRRLASAIMVRERFISGGFSKVVRSRMSG
jgi:hypothetical protein